MISTVMKLNILVILSPMSSHTETMECDSVYPAFADTKWGSCRGQRVQAFSLHFLPEVLHLNFCGW